MNLIQLNKIVIIGLAISISFVGCFDKPGEFVGPNWDTEVNIPITTKEFSLLEIVEKDSSLLKSSENPETMGLIYFGDTQAVSTIRVDAELKLDPFETGFSQSIGPLKINVPIPAASEIRVEDWTTDVTSGSFQVFPEQEGNVNIDVKGVETVESILADQGILTLRIWNRLPVEIVMRGVKIQNSADQSLIAEKSASDPDEWVTVPPFLYETLTFPVNGKTITNSLEYIGTIWSAGSDGRFVQIPEEAGTTILALFEELVIGAATAALPVQSFQFNNSFMLDDSTKIEEAMIQNGKFVLTANNNIDVNLIANIIFENLYDVNDNQFQVEIPLARNEKNKIVEVESLLDWKVVSPIVGTPTNTMSYSIEVITDSTGEVSTISKDDSVSFNLSFGELIFSSFNGLLKPTRISFEETGFKLDYGDFNEQLKFSEINFKDAIFYLNLNSSANLNLLLDGDILATNGIKTNSKQLGDLIIPADEPGQIDITDLINGFSSELPDSFSIDGSALLNPYYMVGEVSRGDSVYGSIDFEFPLNVGIAEGTFRDTLEVDLGSVDEDDINRLNYGEVTISIKNSVPIGLTFSASVLDSNYNSILAIPTLYNNIDFIEIPKPTMSQTGDVLSSGDIVQMLVLNGDDIQILLDNPYLMIQVNFNTAGDNNAPVKFKTSNSISFDIKAKAEYRVEL